MKKLLVGAILAVAFACGIFLYTEWEKEEFTDNLPTPPVAEEIVDVHTHPHPHEHPAPATESSAVEVDSGPGAGGDTVSTSTEHKSEKDTAPVDAESQTEGVPQSGTAWQNDDEHEHQNTQDPFGKKRKRIEDMDPDELADMTLASLLRRFGDIPEVRTFVALDRKKLKNQPLTLDEHIAFTRAQYHLWPDPRTQKALEGLLEKKATENAR